MDNLYKINEFFETRYDTKEKTVTVNPRSLPLGVRPIMIKMHPDSNELDVETLAANITDFVELSLAECHNRIDDLEISLEDKYQEGYDSGYDEGYEEGYDSGYEEGKRIGYDTGYDIANEQAYVMRDEGYDEGYNDGVNSVECSE